MYEQDSLNKTFFLLYSSSSAGQKFPRQTGDLGRRCSQQYVNVTEALQAIWDGGADVDGSRDLCVGGERGVLMAVGCE